MRNSSLNRHNLRSTKRLVMASAGFTLIELIVVIILLGILAATIVPKFFTPNGFEEVTYRNDIISKLRAIQLRAMQQTAKNSNVSDVCHKVVIDETADKIGLRATDSTESDNCSALALTVDSGWVCSPNSATGTCTTSVSIAADHDVEITATDNEFSFDQMGRPVNCDALCTITISGEDTLTVKIENEGYIHAP